MGTTYIHPTNKSQAIPPHQGQSQKKKKSVMHPGGTERLHLFNQIQKQEQRATFRTLQQVLEKEHPVEPPGAIPSLGRQGEPS